MGAEHPSYEGVTVCPNPDNSSDGWFPPIVPSGKMGAEHPSYVSSRFVNHTKGSVAE